MAPHTSLVEAACVIFVFPAMIALGAGQTRVEGVLGKLCRLTGRLSYPLYMVHYPAIYLYAHWMWHTNPAPGLILPVSVGLYVVIIAAAWLIMTYYDEPVRAYLQRRFVDGQLASARASF
jgi:peptidoglycan/LPS O-acetylase OafA/YrhL